MIQIISVWQISVRRKSTTQLCWVITPVPHNLVRRIRFWRLKSPEQDFKYCTARSVEDETRNVELRWGWVFLERTRIVSGIQFTTHFVESFVVETKQFVGSTVHVILTRQTRGQRSSKPAERKRQALRNHFSGRNCYMFKVSKCKGDSDLGLCTTSGLAFGEPQRNDKIQFSCVETRFFPASRHCASVLQTQVPKLCTDLDLSLLYILILGTCSKFTRKNNFLALGVCFPQPCSSAGRWFAASRSRLQNYWRIVSFPRPKMRWNAL